MKPNGWGSSGKPQPALLKKRSDLARQLEQAEAEHAEQFRHVDPHAPDFVRQFLNDNSALLNAEKLRVLGRAFGTATVFKDGSQSAPRVGLVIAELPAKGLSARERLSSEIPSLGELAPRDIHISVKPKTALTSHANMVVSAALSRGARPKVWLTQFDNIHDISAAIAGGAKVVSLSFHHPSTQSFQELAQLMKRHPDVMFVQAAGNHRERFDIGHTENKGTNPFEATVMWQATQGQPIPNWVLVGGHYLSDGRPWEDSGIGHGVFISAPMAKVVERGSVGYREWQALGTSRATPVFAGTATCMLEVMAGVGRYKAVKLLPRDILQLIELSADKDARFNGLNKVSGRLNHERALAFTGALRTMVNADNHFRRKLSVQEAAKVFNVTFDTKQAKALVALAEDKRETQAMTQPPSATCFRT